jgi:hypothetical protein
MLIERRAFSCSMGNIGGLVDEVLALDRTEEVFILFNDLVIPVAPDDTREQVIGRWNGKRKAAAR